MDHPKLAIVSSSSGGLAHYAAHLWRPVSQFAQPIFVTYSNEHVDDLLEQEVESIHRLIDPQDHASIWRTIRFLESKGVSIVNFHAGSRFKDHSGFFMAFFRAVRRRNLRLIVHQHDVCIHRTTGNDDTIVAELARLADALIVGSEEEKSALQALLTDTPRPVLVACHGPSDLLNLGRWNTTDSRNRWQLPSASPIALFFGAIRREKGLGDLLPAFECVRQRVTNAQLVVRCQFRYFPEQRTKLLQMAGPGVRIDDGYLPSHEVESLFKAVDLVVLPYRKTAMSGVLNLARAFCVPVVVTEAFGASEEINGVCGYSVPTGDRIALADAIVCLMAMDPEQRQQMGQGWSDVLRHETWEHSANVLQDACRSLYMQATL